MGEKPKKYHVTDEGDIFRINEDGSFTSMGNAEKMSDSNNEATAPNRITSLLDEKPIKPFTKYKHRKFIWVYWIIAFLLVCYCLSCIFTHISSVNTTKELAKDTVTSIVPFEDVASTEITDAAETVVSQPIKDLTQKTTKEEVTQSTEEKPRVNTGSHVETNSNNVVHSNEGQSSSSIDPNKVYYSVEVQAEFPGGDRARTQWLRDHISWPRDTNGNQLHGDVELEFIIERDGSVSNVKVSYSENPDLNSAAIRLISSMPNWSPAMVKNQPVRSPMGITLFF